jgi:hypothetical protein
MPPKAKIWLIQVVHWVVIIIAQRSIILGLLKSTDAFYKASVLLLSPLKHSDSARLIFVMVFWPPVTAVVEFWIQDNFLKDGGGCYCCYRPERSVETPLLDGQPDDADAPDFGEDDLLPQAVLPEQHHSASINST